VAQLVKAMCYKPEGHGFDSRWDRFIIDIIIPVDSALTKTSTRNIYSGKGGRCVGLTLPPSCVDCLEIWDPKPPGTLRACPGL
jgi:hypothetical protein